LIALLDHADGGLRHYAWTQLGQILGRRLDFQPYGPLAQRRQAIREIRVIWRQSAGRSRR